MEVPLVVFDLAPVNGYLDFRDGSWERARFLLAEFQPASRVELIGSPPHAIRVHAYGGSAEVAPAILARVCELAGCELEVAATAIDDPHPAADRHHHLASSDHPDNRCGWAPEAQAEAAGVEGGRRETRSRGQRS